MDERRTVEGDETRETDHLEGSKQVSQEETGQGGGVVQGVGDVVQKGENVVQKGGNVVQKGGKARDSGHIFSLENFRKVRAKVHVNEIDLPAGPNVGARKLWGYGIAMVAELLAVTNVEVRTLCKEGELDMGDLESICYAWLRRVRSPDYQRRWPVTPEERELRKAESERRRAAKRKKVQWKAGGKTKAVMLPNPEDL